eukprot:6043332-Karenia_brevis.AAC.1
MALGLPEPILGGLILGLGGMAECDLCREWLACLLIHEQNVFMGRPFGLGTRSSGLSPFGTTLPWPWVRGVGVSPPVFFQGTVLPALWQG